MDKLLKDVIFDLQCYKKNKISTFTEDKIKLAYPDYFADIDNVLYDYERAPSDINTERLINCIRCQFQSLRIDTLGNDCVSIIRTNMSKTWMELSITRNLSIVEVIRLFYKTGEWEFIDEWQT